MFADQALASLRIETSIEPYMDRINADQALASLRIETALQILLSYQNQDQALASLRIETLVVRQRTQRRYRSGSREPAD